jgi:tetratricopeptide (TPR) repeat protein
MSSIFGRGPRKPTGQDSSDGSASGKPRSKVTGGGRPAEESQLKAAEVWCMKADALYREGRPDDAIPLFDKALELNPREVRAWMGKGQCLATLGRHDEALGCYNEALVDDPQDAEAWYLMGDVLEKLGRYEEALRHLDKAL